jgi:hypothetical protein
MVIFRKGKKPSVMTGYEFQGRFCCSDNAKEHPEDGQIQFAA